jgi:Tol biopolymer transport system component
MGRLITLTIKIFLILVPLFITACDGSDSQPPAEPETSSSDDDGSTPVTANDDYVYTRVNTQINIDAVANDTGDADASTVGITSSPANAIVNIELDGSITYIPNADYIGLDSFSYSVSNGTSDDVAVVQIGVTAIPERVNVRSTGLVGAGLEANMDTDFPSIDLSSDGRYVVFHSEASNLVDGDTNDWSDAFVHDRDTGETKIVSSNGANAFPGLSITDDGSLVFYHDQGWEINVVDTSTLAVEKYFGVNGGNGVTASGDGRYFAFHSDQSHLLEDTNTKYDIYVYDRQDDVTIITSKSSIGVQALDDSDWPAISTDGTVVAYRSFASNLVIGDTNNQPDVFVTNIANGVTSLVSITPNGEQFDGGTNNAPGISSDGRYVVFAQDGTNDSGIFLRDTQAGVTTRIGGGGIDPDISNDGRYAVYTAHQFAPISGDLNNSTDIVVHDVQNGNSMLVVIGINSVMPNGNSISAAISEDGKYIAFASDTSNLVDADTNSATDVFVVNNPLFR